MSDDVTTVAHVIMTSSVYRKIGELGIRWMSKEVLNLGFKEQV